MIGLRTALLAAAALLMTTAARADLVLVNNGVGFGGCTTANCNSFTDLNGIGFGNHPRILTVQDATTEQGQTAPNGSGGVLYPAFPSPGAPGLTGTNQAIQTGTDKGSAPSLQGLGWNNASQVGIAFDSDQTGQAGITLQTLNLNLYTVGLESAVILLGTFSLAGPVNYTADELGLQPGNGNAAFTFILDAAEQATWNTLITSLSLNQLFIGLSASLGCGGTPSATCQVSNDGPDSFVAIAQPGSPLILPLPAAAWLFGTGLIGLTALGRKRKQI
jgi:hypothetical protein